MDDEPEEARKPKTKPDPKLPSKQEIEEHNITHLPYRSWCPHCVAGRGLSTPHRSSDENKDIPQNPYRLFLRGARGLRRYVATIRGQIKAGHINVQSCFGEQGNPSILNSGIHLRH